MRNRGEIIVSKVDGTLEPFDEKKISNSLIRVGVTKRYIEDIIDSIRKTFPHKVTTEELHRFIENKLKREYKISAMRYSLKKALLAMGPSGYPFEEYISEVFKKLGYRTEVGLNVSGKCITHEIDVLAQKDRETIAIEVKFRNQQRMKTDVKTALYIKARIDDLVAKQAPFGKKINNGILVTNSHFTRNAIRYSECSGLRLIGWDYPSNNALRDIIERNHIHPITCLTSLGQNEKHLLFDRRIVICTDILNEKHNLKNIGLTKDKIDRLLDEAEWLCAV